MPQARGLLETGAWTAVVGLFDPLTAAQARRVESHQRGQMLVIVLESADTLLPADARCYLMAALRSVDFVVRAAGHEWHSIIPPHADVQVIEDPQAEKQRSEEFIQRIIARQGSAAS